MKKFFCKSWHLFVLALLVLALVFPLFPHTTETVPQENLPAKRRILLVPLDGRPPCKNFVIELGKIADVEVMTPPIELQDYYSEPGKTREMQTWLRQEAPKADAVILSIDQLLYGGLLAAREKEISPADETALFETLRALRQENPALPLYAFSILPRLQPPDFIDGYDERRDIVKYSRLVGEEAAGKAVDTTEIARLKAAIPAKSLDRYLARYTDSERVNRTLIDLEKEDVLTRLILGQDDGEPYGIPNIEKFNLMASIKDAGLTDREVFLTHGADEIAMTLLTAWVLETRGEYPSFYLKYADASMKDIVMPYMAVSTDESIREKIALVGGSVTETQEDADILLAVNAAKSESDTLKSRLPLAAWLKESAPEKPTALIDTSYHFEEKETVLPLLIRENFPLSMLAAYAGWNTMSNTAGTAVAAAALHDGIDSDDDAIASPQRGSRITRRRRASLTFLENRILEDNFYLKTGITDVNHALRKAGYVNTADLDLTKNYRYANFMLQEEMRARTRLYKNTPSFHAPFFLGNEAFEPKDLRFTAAFPWPRTFEIDLETTPIIELFKTK